MSAIPRIAIIGAGPAGLTLARLLLVSKAKLDLTLYELDASPTSRATQGGTLDLHDDSGLAALRKADLFQNFQKYARYDGDEIVMKDKNATTLAHKRGGSATSGPDARPEIDRFKLREILLDSVPQELVKWGSKLREVTAEGKLRFEGKKDLDGPFDLVVGADGAYSKVRARLTDVKATYSGVSGYEMDIMDPAKQCPHVHTMIGKGSFGSMGGQKLLNAQRMGNGSLKVRSWYVCEEGNAKADLDRLGKEETLRKVSGRYAGWAPELTELLRQGDINTLQQYTLYELPVGSKWDHSKGVTLLGDAAHLATPFSGEGVNAAMRDACELADLIEQSQEKKDFTLDDAVLRYEQAMFPRAEKLQARTMANKNAMFASGEPPQVLTEIVKSMVHDSSSMLVRMLGTPPALALIYAYFWARIQIGWGVRTFWTRT